MASHAYQPPSRLGNMFIEDFDHEEHLPLLVSWLVLRGLKPSLALNLPEIGFIVYEDINPIACAFLRKVEGMIGICDGLCTNPKASGEARNLANDMLVQQLLETAKTLSMRNLIAWSEDKNTLERSVRHGFKPLPSALITYDLS